jgi:hypothetical protein
MAQSAVNFSSGGGRFMLAFAPPETQSAIRSALNDLIHVPFKFE